MTSNTVKENSMITKKDLNKVALRSLSMEWSWNYERQANLPYCYALIPIINKLYKTDEERAEALKRHLEFFNTTPHLSTLLLGISQRWKNKMLQKKTSILPVSIILRLP